MIFALAVVALVILTIAVLAILAVGSRQSEDMDRRIAAAVEDSTPDPDPVVDEVTRELPRLTRRAEEIEVPREAETAPHYACFDAYVDRLPSKVCEVCLPILRAKAARVP